MFRLLSIIVLILLSVASKANNSQLLEKLDSTLAARPEAIKQKQRNLDFIRKSTASQEPEVALQAYEELYREYYVYRYDTAAIYIDKGLALAHHVGNNHYIQLFTIQKVELLSIAGLYTESEDIVEKIDATKIEPALRFSYYISLFNLYRNLADYSNNSSYSSGYLSTAYSSLEKALKYLPKDKGTRYYYIGDWAKFIKKDPNLARRYYLLALKNTSETSRLHAMTCYVLARNYLQCFGKKGENKYEEYMIRAAISDAQCLTLENLALQKLAIMYYQNGHGDIDRATKYILQALDDAKHYNSRLRILEVSQNLPTIIGHYQEVIKSHNHNLTLALFAISVLVIVLIAFLGLFYRQNKRLAYAHNKQNVATTQLKELYVRQEQMNSQLKTLNERLKDTNKKRDELSKLFIDLCDKFISRLAKYQTLVSRKIKAGQVQQLLSMSNSSRLNEEDSEVFYQKFDKAFLSLYPTFVDEFNGLLRDDAKITPKQDGTLTNDMRVFALIRLGVKESSEISNLLFYTPRTIYNYRSQMKSRAINRDTFEDDVRKLCTVI